MELRFINQTRQRHFDKPCAHKCVYIYIYICTIIIYRKSICMCVWTCLCVVCVVSWVTFSWNPGLAHEIGDLFFLNGDWCACCDAETDQFGSLQGGHISYLCCICWWGGILCLGLGCQAFNAPCWFDPTSLVPHLARITSKLPKPWLSRSVGIIIPNMVTKKFWLYDMGLTPSKKGIWIKNQHC